MNKIFLRFLSVLVLVIMLEASACALEIIGIQPADGSTAHNPRPRISIEFKDQEALAVNKKKVIVKLDGEDISARLLGLGRFLIYVPAVLLRSGLHTITLEYPGKDGSLISRESAFTIALPKLIRSLSHNGLEPLVADDVLEVVMEAPPGGKAEFAYGDLLARHPMKEIKPGIYKGAYKIPFGEQKTRSTLIGYYTSPGGDIDVLEADQLLNIHAMFFKVHILSPKMGEEVGNYFAIKGRTRPFSEVHILPMASVGGFDASPNSSGTGKGLGVITKKADENGEFEVFYGVPIKIGGMKFNVTVYADDPEGNRSLYYTFWVKVK